MAPRDRDTHPDWPLLSDFAEEEGKAGVSESTSPDLPPGILGMIGAQRFDLAEAELACLLPEVSDASSRLGMLLLAAHVRLSAGKREAGLEDLRRALAFGRETAQFDGVLSRAPDILASLCAQALEADIEPCYARCLIDRANLAPPSVDALHWPYPVRIYTLGQAAVLVRGKPLRFSGKAQRRPLLLLHSLLARGGRAVPVTLLRKAMGEDEAYGDSHYTRGAFDMALSRLRRLLPVPELLLLGDGLLSLNEDLCWVDAWSCERLLNRVDRQADPAGGLVLLERALRLYEGDFLAGEESAWAVLARERIRSRLTRVARRLGEAMERQGKWAEAGQLYERLRELFPLDEELCLHLIRSHIKREQFAQASGIYARCRDLLARVLGVLPDPALKALLRPTHA